MRLLLPQLDRAIAGLDRRVLGPGRGRRLHRADAAGLAGPEFLRAGFGGVLHLRSNQGHQRAIALGLYHLHEFTDAEAVVVMDGDGEDRPEDLPELLRAFWRPAKAAK